jgi:head-tail adaptor
MGTLRAGPLRHRVRFLRRREGLNELNEPDPVFDLLFEAWADVRPLSGREVFTAAEHAQLLDTVIELRYLPHQQLTASDRARVYGPQGGTYDIQTVLVPEQALETLQAFARRVDHPQPEINPL